MLILSTSSEGCAEIAVRGFVGLSVKSWAGFQYFLSNYQMAGHIGAYQFNLLKFIRSV